MLKKSIHIIVRILIPSVSITPVVFSIIALELRIAALYHVGMSEMSHPDRLLYLSRKDIEKVDLSMIEIIEALENMFREKGEGRTEMPPKPGIHTRPDAFIHAMPAFVPSLQAAGMKWVSGYPDNPTKGLPYITGLLILNDPETGFPVSVMDCTWITAMRTGAATALSAKYLAQKDSSRVAILACGVQGRSNLEALACLFPLTHVSAFDLVPEISLTYAEQMSRKLGLTIVPVSTPREAVEKADLIVTSGPILKNPSPVIEASWLKQGFFGCALDFDSYWKPEALRAADKITTDDSKQFNYYRTEGYFKETPKPYADLGELAAGKKPGRESDLEKTVAINLGVALSDMTVAVQIYRRAVHRGIGTWLNL